MTPPRAMNPDSSKGCSGRLEHGIISPAHGRIVPSLLQTALRYFQKFFCSFWTHSATIAAVLRRCKAGKALMASLSLPKVSRST
jgi:hypothetical protein